MKKKKAEDRRKNSGVRRARVSRAAVGVAPIASKKLLQPVGPLQSPVGFTKYCVAIDDPGAKSISLAMLPKGEPGKKIILLQVGIEDVANCHAALLAAGEGKSLYKNHRKLLVAALPLFRSIVKGWLSA